MDSANAMWLTTAAVAGLTGVAMGAFGAHVLHGVVSAELLAIYQTGVHYQLWHALAIGLIATWLGKDPNSALLHWAARFMLAGVILFSGSLYALVATDARWLGVVTPLGGTAFLVAWAVLAVYGWKRG
jgi:uncharacterized membrane protein YgdD (TMEM256/DUF423 family)